MKFTPERLEHSIATLRNAEFQGWTHGNHICAGKGGPDMKKGDDSKKQQPPQQPPQQPEPKKDMGPKDMGPKVRAWLSS